MVNDTAFYLAEGKVVPRRPYLSLENGVSKPAKITFEYNALHEHFTKHHPNDVKDLEKAWDLLGKNGQKAWRTAGEERRNTSFLFADPGDRFVSLHEFVAERWMEGNERGEAIDVSKELCSEIASLQDAVEKKLAGSWDKALGLHGLSFKDFRFAANFAAYIIQRLLVWAVGKLTDEVKERLEKDGLRSIAPYFPDVGKVLAQRLSPPDSNSIWTLSFTDGNKTNLGSQIPLIKQQQYRSVIYPVVFLIRTTNTDDQIIRNLGEVEIVVKCRQCQTHQTSKVQRGAKRPDTNVGSSSSRGCRSTIIRPMSVM